MVPCSCSEMCSVIYMQAAVANMLQMQADNNWSAK